MVNNCPGIGNTGIRLPEYCIRNTVTSYCFAFDDAHFRGVRSLRLSVCTSIFYTSHNQGIELTLADNTVYEFYYVVWLRPPEGVLPKLIRKLALLSLGRMSSMDIKIGVKMLPNHTMLL